MPHTAFYERPECLEGMYVNASTQLRFHDGRHMWCPCLHSGIACLEAMRYVDALRCPSKFDPLTLVRSERSEFGTAQLTTVSKFPILRVYGAISVVRRLQKQSSRSTAFRVPRWAIILGACDASHGEMQLDGSWMVLLTSAVIAVIRGGGPRK